eukprot:gene27505-36293_t
MLPASSRSSIAFAWVLIVRIVFSKFATFTDESAVNWNPFKVDEDCPQFVIANVGAHGLGDQLEHYVYFLAVAQALEATMLINGGLVDGSLHKHNHTGAAEYPAIARLLGVVRNETSSFSLPKHSMNLRFAEAVNIRKAANNNNGQSTLRCYVRVISFIENGLSRDNYLRKIKMAQTISKKHIFSKKEAILMEHGKPIMNMEEVKQVVGAALADSRKDCPTSR